MRPTVRDLDALLDFLSLPMREALWLRYGLRMRPSDIARRMGLTIEETRILIAAAVAELARLTS